MQEENNCSAMVCSLWGEEEKIDRLKIVMQVILAFKGKSLRWRKKIHARTANPAARTFMRGRTRPPAMGFPDCTSPIPALSMEGADAMCPNSAKCRKVDINVCHIQGRLSP
jgi:hypothetical protein